MRLADLDDQAAVEQVAAQNVEHGLHSRHVAGKERAVVSKEERGHEVVLRPQGGSDFRREKSL